MRRIVRVLRKSFVAVGGGMLFIIGVILVPLPGPGFLVIFAALALLSTEFEWAKKYTQQARRKIAAVVQSSKARADKLQAKAEQDKNS